MKKILFYSFSIIVMVAVVVVIRTLMLQPQPMATITPANIELDQDLLASHLAEAIRFQTISHGDPLKWQAKPFDDFISWVEETYPLVESNLDKTTLNHTLLYRWQGSDDSLKPILLTGHYDVVPVIPGTEDKWQYPPFAGEIVDGVIWGRGALDDKSGVIGILEAVTYLIESDYKPARTIYLSFGHDEEIGGNNGAARVTEYLKEQGVQLAWSLDEGSFVLKGMIPGLDVGVATINVAEKGYLTLDIIATGAGGHSSMPPQVTAVGSLAEAIVTLQNNPVPGGLEGLGLEMFSGISPYMPFGTRLLFANLWLFGGVVEQELSASATTNAMLRTTTAPTMLSGSVKDNVLPIEASATVNFRLHPRDSVEDIVNYVESLVANDRVRVEPGEGNPASEVADWQSEGFKTISNSIQEVYGDIAVTPGLMVAASDSRHYGQVADNAFRFNPFTVTPELVAGFHGTNEQMGVENFARGVAAYVQILRNGSR